MKLPKSTVALLGGIAVGVAIGFFVGWRQASFQLALWENKVAAVNLKFGSDKMSPQLREYLKARIYSNVRCFYPSRRGYLLAKDWDFGKVDRVALGDLVTFKDPYYQTWDWEAATANK